MALADASSSRDLLTLYEVAPRRPRYWAAVSLLMLQSVIEAFDFVIIGFIITMLAPQWHLTFGQSSIILLAAGLGQLAGALPFARFADRYGRKAALVFGIALYSFASMATALVPQGEWMAFAALRFLIGVGYGGTQLTLLIEMVQTRWRTLITGASAISAPAGAMVAALVFAAFSGSIGWRGIALIGGTPLLFAALLWILVPESVRWLLAMGRGAEARDAVGSLVRLPAGEIALPEPPPAPQPRMRDVDVRSARFWLITLMTGGIGVAAFSALTWGPTILKTSVGASPQDAARLFAWVSGAGIAGRIIWMVVPHFIGRWRSALICCAGAIVSVLLIAFAAHSQVVGVPVILIALMLGAIFYDGGFANIMPFATELYPVRLAALGGAVAHVASGSAKLIGPVLLALVAGSSNIFSPAATDAAIMPAFLLIALFPAIGLAAVLRFRFETNGVPMRLTDPNPAQLSLGASNVR